VHRSCSTSGDRVEAKWFHTHVAKILYLAKRMKPECLRAVAFLSTRVTMSDIEARHKCTRGIVLREGSTMMVKAYIDAAYGVHSDSGKSHTWCAIVLRESGPVFAKSTKQKIVTKSRSEAELVGVSSHPFLEPDHRTRIRHRTCISTKTT
jgi:hypothetical protein